MGLVYNLRKLLKPLSLRVALYIVSALVFIGVYVFVDYRIYRSSYQEIQQEELKAVQRKIYSNIDNLKKLSALTSNRITSSQGDLKRIQNILSSSHSLLPSSAHLNIEKLTYNKLSKPQSRITRFGTLSLKPEQVPSETPHQNGPKVEFKGTSIRCKNWVFNGEGNVEGFLEIVLDTSSFQASLSLGPTLSFVSEKTNVLLQQSPFPIYGKVSDPFWRYAFKQSTHYGVFFLFMLLSLIALFIRIHWLGLRIKKVYREKIQNLKSVLSLTKTELEKTKTAFFALQQRMQAQEVSFQAYKKFQMSFQSHQKAQLDHLLRSLDVVKNIYMKPFTEVPSKDLIEIIDSCLKVVEHIGDGTILKIKTESVKVFSILDNIQELFAVKIHKSNLDVEIICSENLTYHGDPVFIEHLLINVIGKPLHSVPPNGKIIIKATNQKEGLHIHIKDNGFFFDKKILNQLNQSFDSFLSQEAFRKVCQENGLIYEHHRAKNGFNTTKVLFPKAEKKELESNVVPFHRNS